MEDGLLIAVEGCLFCVAVTVFLFLVSSVSGSATAVFNGRTEYSDVADSTVGAVNEDIMEPSVTYEQIIAELMTDVPEYDMIIDGRNLSKTEYNLSHFPEYLLTEGSKYSNRVIRDDDGEIVRVEYYYGEEK